MATGYLFIGRSFRLSGGLLGLNAGCRRIFFPSPFSRRSASHCRHRIAMKMSAVYAPRRHLLLRAFDWDAGERGKLVHRKLLAGFLALCFRRPLTLAGDRQRRALLRVQSSPAEGVCDAAPHRGRRDAADSSLPTGPCELRIRAEQLSDSMSSIDLVRRTSHRHTMRSRRVPASVFS